jgi:hypothetical protein
MNAEWKDVVGFEGLYEVSDAGLVRRAMRCAGETWRNRINTWPGRECKQRTTKDGYRKVGLWKGGKVYQVKVHGLVAVAFLGPRPDGCEVNHKDTDKFNNAAGNLEYLTHQQNMRHAAEAGLWDPYAIAPKGEAHWKAKLSEEKVRWIRSMRDVLTQDQIAGRLGICKMTVCRVQLRQCWRHVE